MAHVHRCRHCGAQIQHLTGEPCQLEKAYPKQTLSFTCEVCCGTGAAYDWSVR